MAKLFSIGTISNASNNGTISGVTYTFFEPNNSCDSKPMHHILTSMYEKQIMLTRKKAPPTLQITYSYENIFDREYRLIEHFNYDVDDALDSFLVVDFSQGRRPTSVTDGGSGNSWICAIGDTRLFSTVANMKSPNAFIKWGDAWRLADITALTANTSITMDTSGSDYGALSLSDANLYGYLFPVYTCRFAPNALSGMKTTVYVDEAINLTGDGGWMRSGDITFLSKYKV